MMKFLLKLNTDKLEQPLPTTSQIAKIVLENNDVAKFVPAHAGALVAVECQNKPREINGCKWEKDESG